MIKIGLNFTLTPSMGINGAALAGVIAFGVAAALNVAAVTRITRMSLNLSVYILKTSGALACMVIVVFGCRIGLDLLLTDRIITIDRITASIVAVSAIALGVLTYMAALLRFKAVTTQELRSLPGMERRLLPLLKKLKLI